MPRCATETQRDTHRDTQKGARPYLVRDSVDTPPIDHRRLEVAGSDSSLTGAPPAPSTPAASARWERGLVACVDIVAASWPIAADACRQHVRAVPPLTGAPTRRSTVLGRLHSAGGARGVRLQSWRLRSPARSAIAQPITRLRWGMAECVPRAGAPSHRGIRLTPSLISTVGGSVDGGDADGPVRCMVWTVAASRCGASGGGPLR